MVICSSNWVQLQHINKFQSLCFGEGGDILKLFCNDQEVVYAMSYHLVVLLENVEKQTNSQTDRQLRESNLTVAEKGNLFQKSAYK